MSLDASLLRQSFDRIVDRQPDVVRRFYEMLFMRYPQVIPLFSRSDRARQDQMLTQALVALLDHLEETSWLEATLPALGAKHAGYGVTEVMYGWVGECLLATFAEVLGRGWTPELAVGWLEAYVAVAALMKRGARGAMIAAAPAGPAGGV
jgi:hemoglobin-like flavoprotein